MKRMKRIKSLLVMAGIISFLIMVITALSALEAKAAEPNLKWNASTGEVTGYKIYYGLESGLFTLNEDVGNVIQYPLSSLGLVFDNTYYFVVRAYNATGESGDSNEANYFWPFPVVNPPINVVYYEGLLTWVTPEGNFDSYKLYYIVDGEPGSMVINNDLNEIETPLLPCGSNSQFYMVTIWQEVESEATPVIDVLTRSCPPTNLNVVMEEIEVEVIE